VSYGPRTTPYDETLVPLSQRVRWAQRFDSSTGTPLCGAESDAKATERRDPSPTRHPASERFHELLSDAGRLHDLKQLDYGAEGDPFANVRATEEWGQPGWVGAMIRATDKLRRLQKLARDGKLSNESAHDSFMDLAVYALIGLVLYEEATGVSLYGDGGKLDGNLDGAES